MKMRSVLATAVAACLTFALSACVMVERTTPTRSTDPAATPSRPPTQEDLEKQAADIVAGMTLKQKVAQLFIITPEALTEYDVVTAAGRVSREAFATYPVGGLIYFAKNLESPDQTRTMLTNMQAISEDALGIPLFLCVDEEGGYVARVANNPAFGVTNVGDARPLGEAGTKAASDAAATIAGYLANLGFNVDFAPVADIVTDPGASPLEDRSFGGDPQLVADVVCAQVKAFMAGGILPCVKHFPGIGAAKGDSHTGAISIPATKAELAATELVPFAAAIDAGVPMVMVGHVGVPQLTGSDIPASMSSIIIESVLRGDLGYKGLIITDALNMGAAREMYSDRRIGVEVLLAGADLILMPPDFRTAYEGVLDAVKSGELTEERIDQSVTRIVLAKLQMRYNAAPSSSASSTN